MTNCYARVYATGHADASADAPEELPCSSTSKYSLVT
jgi:hypothetical protein